MVLWDLASIKEIIVVVIDVRKSKTKQDKVKHVCQSGICEGWKNDTGCVDSCLFTLIFLVVAMTLKASMVVLQ